MTKRPRVRWTLAVLALALALPGCGSDAADERDGGSWADGKQRAPATSPAAPAKEPAATAKGGRPAAATESPSTPPYVLPTKASGAPAAAKVVDAFAAGGLKAANRRDRSADCGPNGLGVGCAQLLITDAVAVYVFPDEALATNQTDIWGKEAYRKGAVVLNYLGTRTPVAEQKRYNDILAKLG
ncbi:hypothetical protein ACFY3U_00495 [Micromonospora sp. NPDC000089]|uniref:hypothetical protein n=1 Tax=unclassified Micromonospora TaxID=2617518 RepID=UPI00368D3949